MLGAVIFYAIPVAYILFVGLRPPGEMSVRKWGAAYGLEVTATNRDFVSTYLRRSKRIRTVGALVGLITSVTWNTITENSISFFSNGLLLAVAGYLAGAVVAELLLQRPQAKGDRAAVLVPRTLGDYLPNFAIVTQRALPVLSVGLIPVYAALKGRPYIPVRISLGGFALIAIALVLGAVLIEAAERMVVRRAQPLLPAELLSADDAVRSASVHALAGGGIALILLVLSYQLSSIGSVTDVSALGWIFPVLAFVSFALALSSWMNLAHPQTWRVRRTVATGGTA